MPGGNEQQNNQNNPNGQEGLNYEEMGNLNINQYINQLNTGEYDNLDEEDEPVQEENVNQREQVVQGQQPPHQEEQHRQEEQHHHQEEPPRREEAPRQNQQQPPQEQAADVELDEEPVLRRSNSFGPRNVRAFEPIDIKDEEIETVVPDDEFIESLPDIGKGVKDLESSKIREEMEALQREREKLRKEREALEQERVAFMKQKEEWEISRGKKRKNPAQEVDDEAVKESQKTAEEEGFDVGVIKDGITRKQAKKVNGMKHLVKDMDKWFRSSPEYRVVKNNLEALDEFMKTISGRTRLTPEEMRIYDKLSLRTYNAVTTYLNRKVDKRLADEDDKDAIEIDGEKVKPQNAHEKARMKNMNEIKNSLDELRREMFQAEFDIREKEMQQKCEDAIKNLENERASFVGKNIGDDALKEAMSKSVAMEIFYGNRMNTLKKSKDFQLKPGESFTNALARLDKSLDFPDDQMAKMLADPTVKRIAAEGVAAIKEGKGFTSDDVKKSLKGEVAKQGQKVIEQKRLEESARPVSQQKKNPERQLKAPVA